MAILAVAALLRFVALDYQSFWYDEVVTMRLARTDGPVETLRLLGEIDATRAPLHPLLLSAWLRWFGISEAAGRSFSAACGVLTVAAVFAIGRRIGTAGTGLWAALLTAASPLLVEYSRETRMYAMLTLVTCVAWWSLVALRDGVSRRRLVVYSACLVIMIYTHPLGMLMAATLAMASFADRKRSGLSVKRWWMAHLAAGLTVAPWLPRYFDHAPEFTSGRLPIRFLLGMPIGFTGGDSRTLALFLALIAIGLFPRPIPGFSKRPLKSDAFPILIWLLVPPSILYAYSLVGHPLFGPARYNVYAAPAFLLLVARGLTRLPWLVHVGSGFVLPGWLILTGLQAVIAAEPKASWRSAAEFLNRRAPGASLIVISPSAGRNFEVEVARYYLGEDRQILPLPNANLDTMIADLIGPVPQIIYFSASLREDEPVGKIPAVLQHESPSVRYLNFRGIRLVEVQMQSETD